jgi:hypothetical protein
MARAPRSSTTRSSLTAFHHIRLLMLTWIISFPTRNRSSTTQIRPYQLRLIYRSCLTQSCLPSPSTTLAWPPQGHSLLPTRSSSSSTSHCFLLTLCLHSAYLLIPAFTVQVVSTRSTYDHLELHHAPDSSSGTNAPRGQLLTHSMSLTVYEGNYSPIVCILQCSWYQAIDYHQGHASSPSTMA